MYGYLPAGTKKLVDSIVDDLTTDCRIAELYDLWYQQRERIIQTYSSNLPERAPLSRNEEFKTVRNAVVKAAVGLMEMEMGGPDPREEDVPLSPVDDLWESEPPFPVQGRGKKKSWWTDGYMQARRYLYGTGGTPCDLEKAAALLTAEARKGNGFAMYDLGKNHLFCQAANHEGKPNAYAAYELGKMCEKGIGIRADEPAAHKWYQQAYTGFLSIEKQFADDKLYYRLGHMNLTGKGTPVDIPQAARYFEKAAKLGNADAEYQLGKLFLHGKEVAQDQARAIAYLTSAAEHGHAYAAQLLQRFYEKDNWTVTASALSLLQQTARIFEDKLQEYYTPQAGRTDRKLLSKIAEKKLAQGQKLG